MLLKIFLIVSYSLVVIFIYILIIKRLRYLTDKHIRITDVSSIEVGYNILTKIIFIFLALDAGLSIFLILTMI